MSDAIDLETFVAERRFEIARLVANEARGLLRFESEEDLVSGATARALAAACADRTEATGDPSAWLRIVTRRYIADRHDHWQAIKRGAGRVLRLSFGSSSPFGTSLATSTLGPASRAALREALVFVSRAIELLPERDRLLVEYIGQSLPVTEQAERLGITYEAAQRAGHRAIERLKKTYELVVRHAAKSRV